jgi:hypothetical protein
MQRQKVNLMAPSLLSCALLLVLFQSHIISTRADIDTLAAALSATENNDAHSLSSGVAGGRQVAAEAAGLQGQNISSSREHASCASQSISSMPLLATSTSSFIVLTVQLSDTADAYRIWKVLDLPLA